MVFAQKVVCWSNLSNMRIKLFIEYDGTNYVGWQKQNNGKSIQEEIENSLFKIFEKKIDLFVAGRTDSGVHAKNQVAHFDIDSKINPLKIRSAINFFLKKSDNRISILDSKEVKNTFHARFSAKKRTYSHKVLNRKSSSPLLKNRMWFIPYKLDLISMREAASFLIGTHDFNSFRSTHCQANSSIRSIKKIAILKKEDIIIFSISAQSFLHNQVRIIVGSLINVGRNYWEKEKILEILEKKDRTFAGPTAPPFGLYLENIDY